MASAFLLDLPDDALSALRRSPQESAREMRLAAVIHWYSRGEVSQEQAAQIAGINRVDFLLALAHAHIDAFVVDLDDLRQEISCG